MITHWKNLIDEAVREQDEMPIIYTTLSDRDLYNEFDSGYGYPEGVPFTAWSKTRVYFPICYDGAESVGSAPREPCGEKCQHQGGY